MPTNRLLPILLAGALSQAAFGANAYVSRCCGPAGSISTFNPETNQLTGTFVTTPGAIDMVLSPDGTRAYVAIPTTDSGSAPPPPRNALVEYLLSTGKAVQSIPLPASPIQLAIDAAGDHVYAAAVDSQGAQRVISVDLATAKTAIAAVTQITPFNLFAVAVSPDGTTLYAALGRKLFTLNAATLAVTGSIALTAAAGPVAAVITPDGATLAVLVGNLPSCALDIVTLATAQVRQVPLATASVPFGAVLSPDGGTVYVNGQGVYAVDLATAAVTGTAVTNSQDPARIAITPDGATLYAADVTVGTTSVIDTASLSVTTKMPTLSDVAAVGITSQGQGYFLNRDGSQVVQVDGS
jgi:YVTN family beta-propeller protein